jgi:hypothetical protein
LTIEQVLGWADAHHERTGTWPGKTSGPLTEELGETWCGINLALRRGGRGLPGGTTLAQLLLEKRGVRHILQLPPLTPQQVLAWADAHHQRTGQWPTGDSGALPEAPEETWRNLDAALRQGRRGLPPGGSLPRLLAQARGVRNLQGRAALSTAQVLAWADAFFAATGRWPNKDDGPIAGAEEETWACVDAALYNGCRGFGGGSSLAQVLQEERGVRNRKNLPALSERQIVAWAKAHHQHMGKWPSENSGPIHGTDGEVWNNVNQALRDGSRGLPGGDTLPKLLARTLSVRNGTNIPPLTIEQVLAWADAYQQRTGQWPRASSGHVVEAPEENWQALDGALRVGMRGLPGGLSLARLLAQHRGVRNPGDAPPLTVAQVLEWADEHHQRTGRWPATAAGPIGGTGETWCAVDQALRKGTRGLPGGDSLPRLLERHGRRAAPKSDAP